ncbi:MAG TPA: serine/threonine-protein kinase [Myxococcota bacterium]|nr:serine/threonine-protein kinase [Myxococcota bacterium]
MSQNDDGIGRAGLGAGVSGPVQDGSGEEAATTVFSDLFCPICGGRFPGGLSVCTEDGVALVPVGQGDDLSGTVLNNKYVLVQLIGRGGFGNVYRATHKLAKTELAIKVIKDDLRDNEKAVRQFLKETRALMSIQSMHVVTVHDVDRDTAGRIFIVMELLRGRDLEDHVRLEYSSTGRMPWAAVGRIVLEVCDALECAHEKGIVHRDLKPGNVMMVKGRGGKLMAKVVDFGIASLAQSENMDLTTMDAVPRVIGTPSFMSPEQAKGQPVDSRADLYSLGAMVYRLVCGCKPFDAKTDQGMLIAHVIEKPRPIRERCPELEVPQEFDALIMQLMAKTPEERPARVEDVAARLRAILPEEDRPPMRGQGIAGWKIAVAVAAVLLVAAGAAAFFLLSGKETPAIATAADATVADTAVAAQPAAPVEPAQAAPVVEPVAPGASSGVAVSPTPAPQPAAAQIPVAPAPAAQPAVAAEVPAAAPAQPAPAPAATPAGPAPRAQLPAVPVPTATSTASGGNIVAPSVAGGGAGSQGGARTGPTKSAIPVARPGTVTAQPAAQAQPAPGSASSGIQRPTAPSSPSPTATAPERSPAPAPARAEPLSREKMDGLEAEADRDIKKKKGEDSSKRKKLDKDFDKEFEEFEDF